MNAPNEATSCNPRGKLETDIGFLPNHPLVKTKSASTGTRFPQRTRPYSFSPDSFVMSAAGEKAPNKISIETESGSSLQLILQSIIRAIPQRPDGQTDLRHLVAEKSQQILDIAYDEWRGKSFYLVDVRRSALRKLCAKLSATYTILPQDLVLKGVDMADAPNIMDSGGFATIFKALHQNGDRSSPVALKVLRCHHSPHGRMNDEQRKEQQALLSGTYREAMVWCTLQHDHVLPFLGVFHSSNIPGPHLCMVLPWMEKGSIRSHIKDLRVSGHLPDNAFVPSLHQWLSQIANGLAYLHSDDVNVVHGDLHGGNILIDDSGAARITDFGLAVHADATARQYKSIHGGGAIRYRAPELHQPELFGLKSFRPTRQSDMYAFALTCIELYTEHIPFENLKARMSEFEICQAIIKGNRPEKPRLMLNSIWDIVQECWIGHPLQRPSAQLTDTRIREAILRGDPEPAIQSEVDGDHNSQPAQKQLVVSTTPPNRSLYSLSASPLFQSPSSHVLPAPPFTPASPTAPPSPESQRMASPPSQPPLPSPLSIPHHPDLLLDPSHPAAFSLHSYLSTSPLPSPSSPPPPPPPPKPTAALPTRSDTVANTYTPSSKEGADKVTPVIGNSDADTHGNGCGGCSCIVS
ncbi:kinase-like domain-containing protein [Cristinia sonorae]|uniref:Kinase-like domain-containing protein n=1 Tax=Cristinia sonorae TaxID=1940300 RepID=A0A8K0UQC5_9AGAR|nr:kinase-like domain-containing protein [Cristinia sonorae]